jgi:hypothetical protein
VVEVRVDNVACPTPGTACSDAGGGLIAVGETVTATILAGHHGFWHLPVTPGADYCVKVTCVAGLTGSFNLNTYTGSDCTGLNTFVGSGLCSPSETYATTVTVPAGNNCLCINLFAQFDNVTFTVVVDSGTC